MGSALHEACRDHAPRRSLGWSPRVLPHTSEGLGQRILEEVAERGLSGVEERFEHLEGSLAWLNRHEREIHACDKATVAFARAYLSGLRAHQAQLRKELTPELVALATSALFESEARMQAFAQHYEVGPGHQLPPPEGSLAAERQASLTEASKLLLDAHEAYAGASEPGEQRQKLQDFLLLRAELAQPPVPKPCSLLPAIPSTLRS